MQDIMVDLETLGKTPGCAIVSIGAVGFDPETGRVSDGPYSIIVSRPSCAFYGLHEDPETLDWWETMPADVAQILDLAEDPEIALGVSLALADFAEWVKGFGPNVRVWGNGSDFDNAILAAAYRAVGQKLPWDFWNNRCYRTLKNLRPDLKMKRIGSAHNAVDDAYSQAYHAIEILQAMRARPWWARLLGSRG